MNFPHHSNPKDWMSEFSFTQQVGALLPYYFSQSEDIRNESVIVDYFTKVLAGINIDEAWDELMSIQFMKRPEFQYYLNPTYGWSIWGQIFVITKSAAP